MFHRIANRSYERKVYQRAAGGMSPRLWLMLSPEEREEEEARRRRASAHACARVHAERDEACRRGVNVVIDETRPDHFIEVIIHEH